MEGFLRDFLCGIGKGDDAPPPEQKPGQLREEMEEEVDLSLGLSLGGLFGIARKGDKLPRSSSESAMMTTPVEVPAPPALPRASGSPSSASSQGDGQRLQGSGTLMRTSSLPAVTEAAGNEEWKKRKEAQSLKRLEVKKKRIERRNSLTCSTSKEAAGQIPEEMNAHTDKLVSCDEAVLGNNENDSSGKHLAKGHPPKYQATITSQDSLSAIGKKPNSAFKAVTKEHSLSSSIPSSGEAIRRLIVTSPPTPSSPAPRTAATLGSKGDQSILGRAAVLQGQTAWGDVERRLMQEMPGVFTKGLPNGNRVEGFMYKYREGEEVKMVCICHGSFLTPSEFVQHAGAGNGKVDNVGV
ncbi:ninja-family protein 4-like [Miscanthus floridulus]|uniref:ninja-family protein 4-like n=1 Tax=Miscanthus floridulus TaxID=154761 RepID=UPI003457B426